jgi:alkanesulfonate monooxygenase SsuD/methylene tetrahydromethanopterin reductase-like flavin-dependent oxidoreductase (luciferase family)
MTDPGFYGPLARAAEAAGFDSMVVPDSICYPLHADSAYPYSPDGSREFLDGKPFIEPFSLIPALGAVTTRLRFVTFVLKLPVRHPVLVAKQATSTAVLTGGRLVLGVGTSPWREDYEVLSVPWEGRGRRLDESVEIIRGLPGANISATAESVTRSRRSSSPRCPPIRFRSCSAVTPTPCCAGPHAQAMAGCTAEGTQPTYPACSPGWPCCAAKRGPLTVRSRCT